MAVKSHTPGRRKNLSQLPFNPTDRRGKKYSRFSFRQIANEGDPATVRRPRRTGLRGRIARQAKWCSTCYGEGVDIEVVLLLSIPGERHPAAVRGKAWVVLCTWIAGEGNDVQWLAAERYRLLLDARKQNRL